jgi:hypothetical protein
MSNQLNSSVVKKIFNEVELDVGQKGRNKREKMVAIFKVNCIESRLTAHYFVSNQ